MLRIQQSKEGTFFTWPLRVEPMVASAAFQCIFTIFHHTYKLDDKIQ